MTAPKSAVPERAIGSWLLVCCALVFAMVLLGGITRLTESGLSIVDWRPATGWLPPFGDAQWSAAFEAYRASPEFRQLNFWMTVDDFRQIFWLEFLHRLLGRLIGVVYLLPFLWFGYRHRLGGALTVRLGLLFLLGGAQGVLGWYMVKSGLVDRPSVSQYRLAAHLGLAVFIYGLMLYTALGLKRFGGQADAVARPAAAMLTALVFVTMIWGAFLAGIDGGATFNTFPLMDGRLVPEGTLALSPAWRNAFDNVAMVQLLHRGMALATLAAALGIWLKYRRAVPSGALGIAAFFALAQFCLGIATILTGASVYIAWAHQAGAMLLFTAAIWVWRETA